MEKYHEICIEKKISKYLFGNELTFKKRKNKSKSPLSNKDSESPKENFEKHTHKYKASFGFNDNDNQNIFSPIINDINDPFLIESKINLIDNPFLSNINKSNFTMKFRAEQSSNSFIKSNKRININNSISHFIENNFDAKFELYDTNTNTNLFSNSLISSDILYSDGLLNNFSTSSFNINFDKKNKDKEIISNSNLVNSNKKEEAKENNSNNSLISNILSEKEKIVIEALIALDKDNNKSDISNEDINKEFEFEFVEYSFESLSNIDKNNFSKDEIVEYEQKYNIYEFVDKRIKYYYNYYKKNKSYNLDENQSELKDFENEINNILLLEENNEKYLFFSFKSLVMGINNLIINWLSNSYFKVYLNKIKEKQISFEDNNKINLDIFIKLMDKYNIIKDICQFLEKDFKKIIDNFQTKKKLKFCLCELLTDLYWDYLFKIHPINIIFTKGYSLDNIKNNVIFEEAKHSMKVIIDILIVNDTSFKKDIGELLDLPYMNKDKIFLMSYIIKFKKNANPFEITKLSEEENIDNKKENKDNSTNCNKNKKNNENKNTDNFSLEEVYKYIQGENDNKKGKKKNKRRQKKKKNKNEEISNKENENNNNDNKDNNNYEPVDPIVEEFRQYFIEYNKNNIKSTKIKPFISQEWIKSISE